MNLQPEEILSLLKENSEHIMTGYQNDFLHDLRSMITAPGVPFIHVTRPMGTHVFFRFTQAELDDLQQRPYLFGRETNAGRYRQNVALLMDDLYSDENIYQYFDGEKVTVVTADRAVELMKEVRK